MGTLSQKIQCQLMPSTIAPPTRGPSATARPPTAPQAPSATPRRSAGTAALRRVRVSGTTIAAPVPWRARATMSVSMLLDSAAAADAPVKSARPTMNIRLRPNRSPSAAPVSSNTANVRVYALTVHSRPSKDAPSSRWMVGRAVLTTRLSSTTISNAMAVTAKVQSAVERLMSCVMGRLSPSPVNWLAGGYDGRSRRSVMRGPRPSLRLGHASLSKHAGPPVGGFQDVHRRHHVEQHAPAHEGGETECLDPRH